MVAQSHAAPDLIRGGVAVKWRLRVRSGTPCVAWSGGLARGGGRSDSPMSRRRWFESIVAGDGFAGRCRRAFSSASSVGHGPCSAMRSCRTGNKSARPRFGMAFILAHFQPFARSGPMFGVRFRHSGAGRVMPGEIGPCQVGGYVGIWPEARRRELVKGCGCGVTAQCLRLIAGGFTPPDTGGIFKDR